MVVKTFNNRSAETPIYRLVLSLSFFSLRRKLNISTTYLGFFCLFHILLKLLLYTKLEPMIHFSQFMLHISICKHFLAKYLLREYQNTTLNWYELIFVSFDFFCPINLLCFLFLFFGFIKVLVSYRKFHRSEPCWLIGILLLVIVLGE